MKTWPAVFSGAEMYYSVSPQKQVLGVIDHISIAVVVWVCICQRGLFDGTCDLH